MKTLFSLLIWFAVFAPMLAYAIGRGRGISSEKKKTEAANKAAQSTAGLDWVDEKFELIAPIKSFRNAYNLDYDNNKISFAFSSAKDLEIKIANCQHETRSFAELVSAKVSQ